MSASLKERMMGKCGIADRHLGPFSRSASGYDDYNDCFGCSWEHVQEFGECVGIVQGPVDFNQVKPGHPEHLSELVGPEVDVRWQPSNLRYAYNPEDLEVV